MKVIIEFLYNPWLTFEKIALHMGMEPGWLQKSRIHLEAFFDFETSLERQMLNPKPKLSHFPTPSYMLMFAFPQHLAF